MTEIRSHPNGAPCWIDIGTSDVPGAIAFYSSLFAWDIEVGPAEMNHYSMAALNGRLVGAIAGQPAPGPIYWAVYLKTDDVNATVEKARAAGGTVIVEPIDVMTFGRMAIVTDPGGAFVSFWQPGEHGGAQVTNESGAAVWFELQTRAIEPSLEFYTAVCGWNVHQNDTPNHPYYELACGDAAPFGGLLPVVGDMLPPEVPNNWLVYFGVDDADDTALRCTDLGGSVLLQPTTIAPGRFAILGDPQGGTFAILQPSL
ncbi:MAG: VOC family protein [Acidimicrobiia bacterium]